MAEPIIKTPWNTEMDPDEFRDYYDQKLERIEELSGECKADGCTNTAEWPRETCSNECHNAHIRQAADRLADLMGV